MVHSCPLRDFIVARLWLHRSCSILDQILFFKIVFPLNHLYTNLGKIGSVGKCKKYPLTRIRRTLTLEEVNSIEDNDGN